MPVVLEQGASGRSFNLLEGAHLAGFVKHRNAAGRPHAGREHGRIGHHGGAFRCGIIENER